MNPKKSLGQNFLKSGKALNQMIDGASVCDQDVVLEIGPGKGALTEKLLETGAKVLVVEKDRELIPLLEEKFQEKIKNKKLKLIEGDILEFIPSAYDLKPGAYKLVANIPYYITGAIIRKFLESDHQPKSMTLLVQKEVAERIVAKDKKESILSLSVKVYGKPKYVGKVSKRYFSPEPKVDSAIIHISDISKDRFKNISEKHFFEVVKTAFGQKRKTLVNNLSIFGKKDEILSFLENKGLSQKTRAEDLSIEDFIELAYKIFPQ